MIRNDKNHQPRRAESAHGTAHSPFAGSTTRPKASARRTVLVVDDEQHVRTILDTALSALGYVVIQAEDGCQAVREFRNHTKDLVLVLMDVRMPEMDGAQALTEMRQIDPSIACCFITGQSGPYSVDMLLALGALRVFDKPFRLPELLRSVQKILADQTPTHVAV